MAAPCVALVRLYSAQDPQKAKAFLNSLPASSQQEFAGLRRRALSSTT
jgi:cellulose synthase operon protein C